MSLFDDAFGEDGFLGEAMKDAAPIEIVYTRGGYSVSITASYAQQAFASQLDGKARVEFAEVSFVIEAADLIINGEQTTPARGDRIEATLAGTAITFELMVPQTREPAWKANPQRTRFKVSCKRVV